MRGEQKKAEPVSGAPRERDIEDMSNVEDVDYNDFLRSPPTSPPTSKKDRPRTKSQDRQGTPDSARKKKKKGLALFGRKRQDSEPDPLSHFSIVSNPLHGHFEQS